MELVKVLTRNYGVNKNEKSNLLEEKDKSVQ